MDPSTQHQVDGAIDELKGKVKEMAGQLTNNPDLEQKGQTQALSGKIQQKAGQIEKVFEK
jgi:uncharacterized protein YjbJ (UPF0337 family)